MYPRVEYGDIVCSYRKKYKGPFKYLITRLVLFFTTAWWMKEPTSKVYHAEIAIKNISESEFKVATMEPPKYRYKDRGYERRVIFRLKDKPKVFKVYMEAYVVSSLGRKYDFLRILLLVLNWIFRTSYFTDHYKNGHRDICSEAVARPYYRMRHPCSAEHPDSTTPDDVYDYCRLSGNFDTIYDGEL